MNKNTLNLHLEILDKERQKVLHKLLFCVKDFVLGGGTALSLQLNHRKSFDFDFFGQTPITKKLLSTLSNKITIGNIAIDTSDELTLFTASNIKLTFLYYPFKPYHLVQKLENGLNIFPVNEIALQKAYTIGRRGEYRDYFDLFTILNNQYLSLSELISQTKMVYGSVFDTKMFLEQLVYFDDLSNFDITAAYDKTLPSPKEVETYFRELVNKFV